MKASSSSICWSAWIDSAASVMFLLLAVWAMRQSGLAAVEAVKLYGRNIDSGAIEAMVAQVFFAPAALALGVSALGLFRRWRWWRVVHWLSWLYVAFPFVWLAADQAIRANAAQLFIQANVLKHAA